MKRSGFEHMVEVAEKASFLFVSLLLIGWGLGMVTIDLSVR